MDIIPRNQLNTLVLLIFLVMQGRLFSIVHSNMLFIESKNNEKNC